MASERTATGVNKGGRPLRWGEPMVTRTVYVPVSFAARVEADALALAMAERRTVRFSEMVVLGYRSPASPVSPGSSSRPGRGSGGTPSPAARSSRSSTRAKPSRETSSGASASHAST